MNKFCYLRIDHVRFLGDAKPAPAAARAGAATNIATVATVAYFLHIHCKHIDHHSINSQLKIDNDHRFRWSS
jgi:hypothetical protein